MKLYYAVTAPFCRFKLSFEFVAISSLNIPWRSLQCTAHMVLIAQASSSVLFSLKPKTGVQRLQLWSLPELDLREFTKTPTFKRFSKGTETYQTLPAFLTFQTGVLRKSINTTLMMMEMLLTKPPRIFIRRQGGMKKSRCSWRACLAFIQLQSSLF